MSLSKQLRYFKRVAGSYYWDYYSKGQFISTCPPHARVLDVGCGNNGPYHFKKARPDLYYVGLDVADYNQEQDPRTIADEYIVSSPNGFSASIAAMPGSFDAVVSAHNIEHCDAPDETLAAMLNAVKPGGRLFLSFPSEASARFPHRKGTLNFYDDSTHKHLPNFGDICTRIVRHGLRLDVAKRRYRPLERALQGLFAEPRCWMQGIVLPETWALYGFETIIWASRPM